MEAHPWHRLERGELTLDEAFPLLFERSGLPPPTLAQMPPGFPAPPGAAPMPGGAGAPAVAPGAAFAPVPGTGPLGFPLPPPFTLDEGGVELAQQLSAAGLRLALCANVVRDLDVLWRDLHPWSDLFPVMVLSYELGARKPEELPYKVVLERLGTAPAETLFLDDSERNLQTAQALGMPTVLIDGPESLNRVRTLLGLPVVAVEEPPQPATATTDAQTDTARQARDDEPSEAERVLAAVRALARRLPDRAAEIERARGIPRDIVEDLRDTGIFRALYPRSLGGPDLTDAQIIEAIEALATGDASVAWCAAIGLDAALCVRAWSDDHVREVFPSPDLITAAVLRPQGRGVREDGGFRLDGEWALASGIGHADRVLCGFMEIDPDRGTEMPAWWIAVLDPADVRVRDTWHSTGLCGTGSHDIAVRDVWVPEERAFLFLGPERPRPDGFSLTTDRVNAKTTGVALGIGTAALDAAVRMLRDKVDSVTGQPMAAHPRIRANVARAESLVEASRAYVYRTAEPGGRRGDAALARQFAHQSCREAVELLYDTVGSASLYTERTPLDRHLRDIVSACQHVAVNHRILEGVGELRLGGNPMSPFI